MEVEYRMKDFLSAGALSVWSLHVLSVPEWAFTDFLPQSKDIHIRVILNCL